MLYRLRSLRLAKNVKVQISIQPNGNDTVKFDYTMTLVFDDGDPNTARQSN